MSQIMWGGFEGAV